MKDRVHPPGDLGRGARIVTVVAIAATSFMSTFSASAITVAIPAVSLEFKSGATLIGWIVTGYMLPNAALSVPFGRIADLTGRKRILTTGILAFALFAALCAFAPSTPGLIGARVLQGIASAMIFSTNVAILIGAFPPDRRGRVIGYTVAATYAGLSAGPVLGGFLSHAFGWRSIFFVTAAMGLIVFGLAVKFLPRDAGSRDASDGGVRFDRSGSLLYIAMILCVMYGFSSFADVFWAKFLIPAGLFFGVLFVLRELRTDSPIVQVRLFAHNPNYALSNVATLLNYGATFAAGYFMSLFLQLILGFDAQMSGLILICNPLLMAVVSPFAGKLSDRVSPFTLASVGMCLCALGLFSFVFLTESFSLVRILVGLVVLGLGFGLFSSPNTNAIMSCVAPRDTGVASSLLATMRAMGQTSSMAVITLVVSARLGDVAFTDAPKDALVGTMRIGFAIFTALCVAGVFLSLGRRAGKRE